MYEKICKVIELYNQYKGNLNDDGTVATDEQIAEWIVASIENYKEEINEEKLEKLAVRNNIYDRFADDFECENYYGFIEGFKVGYRKAKEQ